MVKLKHGYFIRFIVIAGCVGTIVHGVQTMTREPYDPITPWWGFFGVVTAACLYGVIWAITPENWWRD